MRRLAAAAVFVLASGVEVSGSAQVVTPAPAPANTVYFAPNGFQLDEAARATLAGQVQSLRGNPLARISIEGHGDERSTRAYALALGERRATAAKNFLVAQGIAPERVSTLSWGRERPAVVGAGESAQAQNRRAVITVVR